MDTLFSSANSHPLEEKNLHDFPQTAHSPETIETPEYIIRFSPDNRQTAELTFRSDITFTDNMAREIKRNLEQARPGQKLYLLVGSLGFFRVTKKARSLGAKKKFSDHLAAVACFTNNASLALLGELYNQINKPAVPTRLFGSRDNALEWLNELRKQQLD